MPLLSHDIHDQLKAIMRNIDPHYDEVEYVFHTASDPGDPLFLRHQVTVGRLHFKPDQILKSPLLYTSGMAGLSEQDGETLMNWYADIVWPQLYDPQNQVNSFKPRVYPAGKALPEAQRNRQAQQRARQKVLKELNERLERERKRNFTPSMDDIQGIDITESIKSFRPPLKPETKPFVPAQEPKRHFDFND